MVFIRLVEERISNYYDRQLMRCPIHLSIGQEASAVGVCANLSKKDRVFSTHRCHAHYLALGADLNALVAELHGKVTGCNGGRGGSMHLSAPDCGLLASVPIVASSIPLAAGTALADKLDGSDAVSVTFFGDACMEEGIFFEVLNFSKLHQLPVLFVCENNFFSVYTNLEQRQAFDKPEDVVASFGIKTFRADGNDVRDVYSLTKDSLEYIRAVGGPAFLILDTYRYREHCGPNSDDHLGYRDLGQVRRWLERDPILLFSELLNQERLLDEDIEVRYRSEINTLIDLAFDAAESDPLPIPETAAYFVYDQK